MEYASLVRAATRRLCLYPLSGCHHPMQNRTSSVDTSSNSNHRASIHSFMGTKESARADHISLVFFFFVLLLSNRNEFRRARARHRQQTYLTLNNFPSRLFFLFRRTVFFWVSRSISFTCPFTIYSSESISIFNFCALGLPACCGGERRHTHIAWRAGSASDKSVYRYSKIALSVAHRSRNSSKRNANVHR